MLRIGLLTAVALVAVLLGVGGAPVQGQDKFDLENWDYEELRTGWSVERLTDEAEVVGEDGEKLGEVEDLIVGPDGKIKKLVIEAGGFLDIGDAHIAYPFAQATFDGPDRIVVALDEDKVDEYSLFAEVDDDPMLNRNWRVSELMHDYVYLEDGYRLGWVNDAVIGADGTIKAVVVYPDVRVVEVPRPVALPFLPSDATFDPGLYYYQLPFTVDEIAALDMFTYDELERGAQREVE